MTMRQPAMLRLLGTSWRRYRLDPSRLALMVGGIALGVALIAALDIVNASVVANFRSMLERAAGKAALQVELGTGEVGFDEAVAAAVATDPDVAHAFGMVRGSLHAANGSGEVLQLFGIDLGSDAIDSYDVRLIGDGVDPVELLNDPRAVFVGQEYAARAGLAVGSRARFATPTGIVELHVRGLLEATGLATVFGGNLAIMDLFAAQRLLDKSRRIDQVDVLLDPAAITADVRQRLAAALPGSLSVNRPATRSEQFERAIAAFQAMLDGLSLLCLLAGIFIVFNTIETAIAERARDLATMLTLGTAPRRILALVLVEALAVGAVASAIGIALGIGLALGLTSLVAESMGAIFQVRFPVETLRLTPGQVAWYLTLGTGAAIAAAVVPAVRASRLDPIALLRPDYRERLATPSSNRRLVFGGVLLIAASVVAVTVEQRSRSIAWGNIAATLWWLSALVLSIPAMSWIAALCQRALPRWFGVAGQVAAAGLSRSPSRTGVTVGAIALSLALAVTVASSARSFRESHRRLFTLVGDLVVSAVGTEGGWLESPLSAEAGRVLQALPGVARVETYRALQGQQYGETRIAVVAVSPGLIDSARFRSLIVEGDGDEAVRAIAQGTGVVVSDNLAEQYGLEPGGHIHMPAPAGPTALPVAAVITGDFSGDRGSVILNRDQFAHLWAGDTQVSRFNVFLDSNTSIETARAAIVQALRDRYLVKVLTIPQTLAYHQDMVDRAFAFTYAIQLLVIAVTLAGIVDLLTTQIVERRREIGVLRLIGTPETVVARAIWLEASVIGLTGAVFGTLVSAGTSRLWVGITFPILVGYTVEHYFALLTAVSCVLLAAGVALLAGRLAAKRALEEPALNALRFE